MESGQLILSGQNGELKMKKIRMKIATKDNIHSLVRRNKIGSIEALLNQNPGLVTATDHKGRTPLMCTTNYEVLALLVQRGADVNAEDEFGRSALHHAAEEDKTVYAKNLIRLGANVDIADKCGWTPIFISVGNRNMEMTDLLIREGANLDVQGAKSATPLLMAFMYGNLEIVFTLLNNGANINAATDSGNTLLHYAALWYTAEALDVFRNYGGDMTAKNKKGLNPAEICQVMRMYRSINDPDSEDYMDLQLVV